MILFEHYKMRRNNTNKRQMGGYVKSKDISWSPGSGIPDSNYQEGRVEIELLKEFVIKKG